MKGRVFGILLVLLTLVLCLVVFSRGLLNLPVRHEMIPSQQPLNLPRAARFSPNDADLTLHLMVDPREVQDYVEVYVSPKERKIAKRTIEEIRDAVFTLVGLDFDSELSDWINYPTSFTYFNSQPSLESGGWVLALAAKDEGGSNLFLQKFWEKRSSEGFELDQYDYNGIEITTGKDLLVGDRPMPMPMPMASALVSDDLILISSRQNVLEHSLESSGLISNNQFGDAKTEEVLTQIDDGLLSISISYEALISWFQFSEDWIENKNINRFIGGIYLDQNGLNIQGLLEFINPLSIDKLTSKELALMDHSIIDAADSVALIQSSKTDLNSSRINKSLTHFISSILEEDLSRNAMKVPLMIFDNCKGPLLWVRKPQGWLIGMDFEDSDISNLDKLFNEQGFSRNSLKVDQDNFQVWSRLGIKQQGGIDQLFNEVAAILYVEGDHVWWGETLGSLQQQNQKDDSFLRSRMVNYLTVDHDLNVSELLVLGSSSATEFLERWHPWILLQTLKGSSLQSIVKGFSLALGFNQNDDPGLFIRASFQFGFIDKILLLS